MVLARQHAAWSVAAMKSPSALSTHSLVRGFIENFAFLHDLTHEEVTLLDPTLHQPQCAHQQIHWEKGTNTGADLGCFARRVPLKRQDYQQIYIGISSRPAIGIGAKQDDALWVELLDDTFSHLDDVVNLN